MNVSTTAAVVVATSSSNGSMGAGPAMWMGIMLFLMVPFFLWVNSPQCMASKHGFRNATLVYSAIGAILMVVILYLTKDDRPARPEKVVSAECRQIIERHKALETHTQEEIHQYLKCEPDAGVGWMLWSMLGFVTVVSVGAFVMEHCDTA